MAACNLYKNAKTALYFLEITYISRSVARYDRPGDGWEKCSKRPPPLIIPEALFRNFFIQI
ncbi:hypothetical protein EEL51_07995 [Muribaculaceae bacterium Isolate-110 (HZI)]|nr:hypothetical protein EEL51_07995 [Muribaculaceae bacterium Isolate-110 (HZI)]